MTIEFFTESSPESVAEQAATWLVEFDSGPMPEAHRREFVAWLKRSPVHVEEFLQISALQREIGHSPALQASLEEVLADAGDTIVTLDEMRVPPSRPAAKAVRKPSWRAVAAGVLVLVTGALAAVTLVYERGVYRTGVGEQRSVALEDGSVITLNTRSEVRVSFEENVRRVTLVDGEAMFDVAHDAERPFHVRAGPMAIRVVGTRFNVYRRPDRTTVTVIEGKVDVEKISPPQSSPLAGEDKGEGASASRLTPHASPTLTPGEQAIAAIDGDILQPPPVDIERVTAWTKRRAIFENAPLSEVAAEFNRYNRSNLVLEDPSLAARRVTGVFQVHDLDVLVSFLRRQDDIRVERDGRSFRILPERRYRLQGANGEG